LAPTQRSQGGLMHGFFEPWVFLEAPKMPNKKFFKAILRNKNIY
jgi:hypothetical protein